MSHVQALRDAVNDLRTTAGPIDHPEGIAWFGEALYCGTEAGQLLRIDPSTGWVTVVAETGGFLLGLAFDAAGRCYACDSGQGRLVRIWPDGQVEALCDAVEGRRLVNPNYPAFTSDGTLWVSESGTYASDDGYLFRIRPGHAPEVVDEACRRFPNGIAISPDERALHLVESRLPGIVSYALDDEIAGPRRQVLEMPYIVPDGLAFDAAGALYISCWRPDRVYRLAPGKQEPEVYLDDWTAEYLNSPTNLCFGGEALDRLYFASLCGWTITEIDVDVPGHPLPRPSVS